MAYEYITKYNAPAYTPAAKVREVFGHDRKIESITIHWWSDKMGQSFDGPISWLTRPDANTSAHYVVEAGRVACLVDVKDAAWHAGSAKGNATSIGIELRPEATDADYQTAAELIAKLRSTYGDLPLIPHKDWKATTCPGRWNLARLDRLARGTTAAPAATGQARTHTVRPGEGWGPIAWDLGVSVDALLRANGATLARVLHPGDVLTVPAADAPAQKKAARRTSSATHNGQLIRYHVFNEDLANPRNVAIFLHGDNPRADTRDGTGAHIRAMAQAARAAGWVLVVPVSPTTTWWLAPGQSSGMRVVAPQLQALRSFIPAVRAEVGLTRGGAVLMGHSGGAEAIAEHLARTDVAWTGGSITAMLVGGGTPNTVHGIDTPAAFRKASRMTWAGSKDGDGLGATTQSGGTWSAWASAERGERAYREAGYTTRLVDTRAPGHSAYDFGALMSQLIKEATR